MILDEIRLAAREDFSIRYEEVMGNVRIGYHHEELVSQKEGEEWAVCLRPNVQRFLWVPSQKGIAHEGPRGYRVAMLIDYVTAGAERDAVNCSNSDQRIKKFGRRYVLTQHVISEWDREVA